MKPLRVGIIGAGDVVSRFHLNPGGRSVPDCEAMATCNISRALAGRVAQTFDIHPVFTDMGSRPTRPLVSTSARPIKCLRAENQSQHDSYN